MHPKAGGWVHRVFVWELYVMFIKTEYITNILFSEKALFRDA